MFTHARFRVLGFIIAGSMTLSSCYTYQLATKAQAATDTYQKPVYAYSLFWGLLNKPQIIRTPACDNLESNGVAEVTIRTNFGFALLTVATLGIYCPVKVMYKCGKPCQQVGHDM